jgi:hypothetical protein
MDFRERTFGDEAARRFAFLVDEFGFSPGHIDASDRDRPFVRGIRLAWWSTGPGCGPTDDSSAPCWSVYAEDRLTGRLTPCGN